MASTDLTFASREAHRAWLATQAVLPCGFRTGTSRLQFTPAEIDKPAHMNLTIIATEQPTPDFAAVFTRNAFPGAPVLIGRRRLAEPALGAIIVNNKVSNVRAPDGEAAAERLCDAVAGALGISSTQVLPSSTGVIGWRIPIDSMLAAVPAAATALPQGTLLDAAQAILTTDLYPKIRRVTVGEGSIVGIAKGAGMIEPNMATMLVYLLTDLAVPRATLRRLLPLAVEPSFNAISVDSDTSTSDTVVLLSSGAIPCPDEGAFAAALSTVCADLAEDIVRGGEGVHHVIRVTVMGAPNETIARGAGKSIVNSPLVKTAICGNDPNVGRIIASLGKYLGAHAPDLPLEGAVITLGGKVIYENRAFRLEPGADAELVAHLRHAEMYQSRSAVDGVFRAPVDFPPHERRVELVVDLAAGPAGATVLGGDLTHEYISENADYRS